MVRPSAPWHGSRTDLHDTKKLSSKDESFFYAEGDETIYSASSYSSSPAFWNPVRSNIRCDCVLKE